MRKLFCILCSVLIVSPLHAAAEVSAQTGDLNADGTADAADIRLLADYLTAQTARIPDPAAADLNEDGKLNAADLTLLKRLLRK